MYVNCIKTLLYRDSNLGLTVNKRIITETLRFIIDSRLPDPKSVMFVFRLCVFTIDCKYPICHHLIDVVFISSLLVCISIKIFLNNELHFQYVPVTVPSVLEMSRKERQYALPAPVIMVSTIIHVQVGSQAGVIAIDIFREIGNTTEFGPAWDLNSQFRISGLTTKPSCLRPWQEDSGFPKLLI